MTTMAGKKQKLIVTEEMQALAPYFLAISGVYAAVLIVLFFAAGYDWTLFTGWLWGTAVCVGNFYLLGRTAQNAVRRRDAKSAQTYMNSMYCLRYLGIFAALVGAALIPWINLMTAILPIFFPRIAITIRAIKEKGQ
ncbi:MAG: ATP synthase subunit I [Oscillospiraceae bacterium]